MVPQAQVFSLFLCGLVLATALSDLQDAAVPGAQHVVEVRASEVRQPLQRGA